MAEPMWIKVAEPGELADGSLKGVEAAGTAMVLACVGGRFSALGARCPHAGGPLAQGTIESGFLVCPWHGREFDLRTGACDGHAGIDSHPVQVREDGIYVTISTPGAK